MPLSDKSRWRTPEKEPTKEINKLETSSAPKRSRILSRSIGKALEVLQESDTLRLAINLRLKVLISCLQRRDAGLGSGQFGLQISNDHRGRPTSGNDHPVGFPPLGDLLTELLPLLQHLGCGTIIVQMPPVPCLSCEVGSITYQCMRYRRARMGHAATQRSMP